IKHRTTKQFTLYRISQPMPVILVWLVIGRYSPCSSHLILMSFFLNIELSFVFHVVPITQNRQFFSYDVVAANERLIGKDALQYNPRGLTNVFFTPYTLFFFTMKLRISVSVLRVGLYEGL
ncbi:hypothetical protein L9F63_011147, partial [Diploptera punctata]